MHENPMVAAAQIRALEARSINAWPAIQTVVDDGWVQRFAGDYTSRANSIHPLYPGDNDLGAKIDRAEGRYRAQGITPTFKLTAAAEPPALDAELSARGYQQTKPTSVQIVSLPDSLPVLEDTHDRRVLIETRLSEDWLAVAGRLRGMSAHDLDLMTHILRLLVVPAGYVRLIHAGEPVAVGLGVLDDGWIGLYDIATAEHWRGRGFGRAICQQIMAWGRLQGAQHAYLQVMLNNAPALRLYRSLGFREAYTYWYRVLSDK